MKILLSVFLSVSLFAENSIYFYGSGAAGEKGEYSYSSYNLLAGARYGWLEINGEQREGKFLGSLQAKTDLIYFAAGHRFKPVDSFYFLKAPGFYSAFQNPKTGAIGQPMRPAIWLGTPWAGVFWNEADSRPGYYLGYGDNSYIYYPGDIHLLFVNLRKKKAGGAVFTLHSETVVKMKQTSGYIQADILFPASGISIFQSGEKGGIGVVQNPEANPSDETVYYMQADKKFYSRLEYYEYKSLGTGILKYYSAMVPVLQGHYGCVSLRGSYGSQSSGGLYYEISGKKGFFSLGADRDETQKTAARLAVLYRPYPYWKAELVYLRQAEGMRSLVVTGNESEYRKAELKDETQLLQMRFLNPYVALTVTAGQTGSRATFDALLQFRVQY